MFENATAGSGANASTVGYSLTDFSDGPQPHSQPWDTSDPFFSASTRVLLQRVLKCYFRQPIVFVGISGNFLCCAVFLKANPGPDQEPSTSRPSASLRQTRISTPRKSSQSAKDPSLSKVMATLNSTNSSLNSKMDGLNASLKT
ncbi:hypothetical protein ACOMHN_054234 [Nucella lapillus]